MTTGRVAGVRAGRVRTLERPAWDRAGGRTWNSAYLKDALAGPIRVTVSGIEGDEQADRAAHGGPDRALLAYALSHYPRWRGELGIAAMGPGGFGENLTVEGFDDGTVCIGDVFEVGGAQLQVSQPRAPCAAIARVWDRADMVLRVTATARTGWYLRVLREGLIVAGQPLTRLAQPHPEWSVERVFRLKVEPERDLDALAWLAGCEPLTPEWRESFARQHQRLTRGGGA